jgi:cobalt-zinc-cadmium resistance protein CzcA
MSCSLNPRWRRNDPTDSRLCAEQSLPFHNLPVEAYPDVANNYVNIITQWPGHSAEDIEQQVTVPTEIQMAGIPHLQHLRSTTLAGLSSIMLIFDDESDNNWNRERVVERMGMISLPAGLVPQLGTDWSPVGQIYFYTIESNNPKIDVIEIKSIEDWTLEKQFKQVPGVVDVTSLGGETKEYQTGLPPEHRESDCIYESGIRQDPGSHLELLPAYL